MKEIIPAIIPENFSDLKDKVSIIAGFAETVQVDICDGKFVPSENWPLVGDNGEFEKIKEEKGLPESDHVDYEIHVMAETPNDEVADWARAGASRIIVHIETGSDTVEDIIEEWGHTVEIGIAINLNTPVSLVSPFLEKVKVFQLMGIERVGFQGQGLDERIFGRIKELRGLAPKHIISIDGGVNLENAGKLIKAGANRLVVGSAIWKSKNPIEIIKKFKNIL